MKSKAHYLIFAGIIGGALVGLCLNYFVAEGSRGGILDVLDLFGKTLFIGSLKMIVAPLIFFSIIAAITSIGSTGEMWRIGWKTLAFYLMTTSVAVILGLVFVHVIKPGFTDKREEIRESWQERQAQLHEKYGTEEAKIEDAQKQNTFLILKRNLESIIENPFKALAESHSLGIIFFAILLGIALVMIGEVGAPVLPVLNGLNAAIMKITGWIMAFSAFFIFCLVASIVGSMGLDIFNLLFWYVVTVLGGIGVHIIFLLSVCYFAGKIKPLHFLKSIKEAYMVSFATRSTAVTLPVSMDSVQNRLGVSEKVTKFVMPLGATINMDGTALYEGVAVIFLIQLFGGMTGVPLELTAVETVLIFLTAVLASIGAAAIPDSGLVTMVLVANAVGLSVEYITIIFAVDAFLDMFRTSTNMMGDCVGAIVVDRLEKKPK
ncbi:MAG: dicarboxylate/amino acid:cation symporter [Planctomycetes bacterium]|nr:dicarboxylate/amino acid:cation symporter [Planctomycetota bacterium]